MLSKEQFINAINDVENVCRYQEGLNNYFRKNNVDGYIFQPDCSSTVIGLLHTIFGEKDKDIPGIHFGAFRQSAGGAAEGDHTVLSPLALRRSQAIWFLDYEELS